MRARISSENGVIAAARRGITFSNDPFFLGRCAWARTLRTSAHARQRKRKVLRPPAGQVPRHKERRLSPGAVASAKAGSPAPSAAASPSPASSPAAAAATSPGAIASKPPTSPGPASPPPSKSPATAAAAGTSPAAAASPPAAGPPWPEQTAGLPPMYSAAWHHVHLYSPRSINFDSNMPSYRFLYQTRRISDARSSDALQLTGSDAPPEGWEIVPTYDAKCLVAYMMALNQSHPLKDVRSAGAPAAASPAASPSPAPGGQPAK